MNCTAIICEYNPFHNGHKYLIEEAKKTTGSKYTVAIMSGNYVQRGEPACIDKWTRAKIALSHGVDAVIEIPSIFSAGSAQFFAEAGIDLINKSGIIDAIAFGSESANIESLMKIGKLRAEEPEKFRTILKSALKSGSSYSASMEQAIGMKLKSNDILAVEYLAALYKSNSTVKPFIIKRAGNTDHNDASLSQQQSTDATALSQQQFTSATALRQVINKCNCNKLADYMPDSAAAMLSASLSDCGGAVTLGDFSQIIIFALRKLKPEGIRNLPYVSEGFEYRLYEAACNSGNLENIIDHCTSSRYTKTRVTRILTAILTGATSETHKKWRNNLPYIKVLGFRKESSSLISEISAKASVPVILQPAKAIKELPDDAKSLLELEAFATDNYTLGISNIAMRKAGQEYTRKIVIV